MAVPRLATLSASQRRVLLLGGTLVLLVVWSTWSILAEMAKRWEVDPTYSHGFLVPLIVLLTFWMRRDRLPEVTGERLHAWSLGLFALGLAMQLLGAYYYVRWVAGASLVAYLCGVAALVGGWPLLRWSVPGLAFFFFMVPLPYRFETLMRAPLQRVSTVASAFALQTLGVPVVRLGNILMLGNSAGETFEVGVVDACSGLKMLIVFFCLTSAFAILVHRPLGERLLILLSTLPIALICNVARITATGVAYVTVGEKLANLVFHDLAGLLMMPLALLLLLGELKLLTLLFVDETPDDDTNLFRASGTFPGRSPNLTPSR